VQEDDERQRRIEAAPPVPAKMSTLDDEPHPLTPFARRAAPGRDRR
jgi:hypothetical protein